MKAVYLKCGKCQYACRCCKYAFTRIACSGCEQNHDEFVPAENIKCCPLNGDRLTVASHYPDLVGKWIAYKVKGNDAVMHGQVVDFPPGWYIQVKKKHNRTNMVELADVIKVFDSREECYAYK